MKEGILRSEAQQTTEYINYGKVRRIDLTIRGSVGRDGFILKFILALFLFLGKEG